MYLIKNKQGLFSPVDDSDFELSKKIKSGEVVKASKARNYLFHKKIFALMQVGFSNQERYTMFEVYRKYLLVKCGYFDEIEVIRGEVIPQAQSLSFESMSAETFEKVYNDVLRCLSEEMHTEPEDIQNELNSFI